MNAMSGVLQRIIIVLAISASAAMACVAQPRAVTPVLEAPEPGLDDTASYQGYQTRFFRDVKGNVVQVYLDARSGRVVTLLGNAVNESVGFTVRDESGRALRLEWGGAGAVLASMGDGRHSIEYQLVAKAPRIQIGWILLGSMRVERDLQYSGRHLQPFGKPTFRQSELEGLVANIERLDSVERRRHLALLRASHVSDLRARLEPDVLTALSGGVGGPHRTVIAAQSALDGKTALALEIGPVGNAAVLVTYPSISITGRGASAVRFTVRVTTDAPALTSLSRDQIFNADFMRFLAAARASANVVSAPAARVRTRADSAAVARFRRLERDVRGLELLSSKEKLMAGLPNYATYFGRDMMMSALMMEPIWSASMAEHVIASVLRKLGPGGDVSHEEALGGQAIRENAAEYNALIGDYLREGVRGNQPSRRSLDRARSILADLQKVRENYSMLDDEFQLPVLTARYLANPSITSARKLAFLMDSTDGGRPRVQLLLRELGLVARLAEPYARDPVVENLVASPRQDSTRWRSVSWRDSGAGYANGRYAMDINAIWVPRALESLAEILVRLRSIGISQARLAALTSGASQTALAAFARDSALLRRAVENWNGAERHFVVALSADEVRMRVEQKLASLPANERTYWQNVLSQTGADRQPIEFLALSLDATGRPIPVVNTDPATALFLGSRNVPDAIVRQRVTRDVRTLIRAYPAGLLVLALGPLVANDAYASPAVWEAFEKDLYHSPRVVWGREVNLIMLGLARHIAAAVDESGRARSPALAAHVSELREILDFVTRAVNASGLKHNELWSYEIVGAPPRLRPIRYGASTDIQLWNVTDLAVQFVLSRLPGPPSN